ncbi:linear amide C-N hydrolase [Morganella morganii]|uniref:linear amide C-N hydrolase n=1 Tax=Morganella morganii TaxID=582 RepID=UPI00331637BD
MMKISVKSVLIPAVMASVLIVPHTADACTRFVYHGKNNLHMTARSMDWSKPAATNLWIFPRGMSRKSDPGKQGITWTSRYGSVIASADDMATTDGLNEKGLSANQLWLTESVYPDFGSGDKIMPVSIWAQYVLDNFATVKEAVKELKKEPFVIVTDNEPGTDRLVSLHLSVSDAAGDSAVIEYIDGKLVIYHGNDSNVVTNSPIFNEQLALGRYWEEVDGRIMLPGSRRSTDRFVRAKFYSEHIPENLAPDETVAAVLSVIRHTSVPYRSAQTRHATASGPADARSSTRWRSVADHRNKRYYFDAVMAPGLIWVDLNNIDFSGNTGTVRKLALGNNQKHGFTGNVNSHFRKSEPFEFISIGNRTEPHYSEGE